MPVKPSQSELEYFAREENEKIHRLAERQRREQEQTQKEQSKASHFMKCPKCGSDLHKSHIGIVEVEECGECDTLVLDKKALEKVKVANHNLLKSVIDLFHSEEKE